MWDYVKEKTSWKTYTAFATYSFVDIYMHV